MPEIDARLIIGLTVIGAALIYDVLITFWKPIADPNVVGTILGTLNTGGFAVAIQYYLGSSKSSREKDSTIHNLSQKQEGGR